jgi:predicted aspartyl protease
MGIFYVDCEVVSARQPSRKTKVAKLLVDSGSEFTWIPATALKKIGVGVAKKDTPFQMANGQTISRDTGYAILRVGSFETVDEVVFAQDGDLALLGARTLEGFGAVVDPRKKRLVAAGPHPVAVAKGSETTHG